jgi:SAM-dependent methyltransferase
VAADYHEVLKDDLRGNLYDRAALGLFASLVPEGLVGDLGCGPGRITTYLASLGLDAFGIDLSPEMVGLARATYPSLRFEVGTLFDLELKDGELAGALAWYSLVHTPREDLPAVFAELHRVVQPGGYLLHAFKVGGGIHHLEHAYGHEVDLDVYWYDPADITDLLTEAGFAEVAMLTHAPLEHEKQPQAYLLMRKPG